MPSLLTIPSFFQENILSKSRTLTVENKFSVPVVVHSLDLPEQARQVFQLGKFKAKVSIANYLFIFSIIVSDPNSVFLS